MKLVLSRCTPSDIDAITPVAFEAFAADCGWLALFGPNNPANVAHTRSTFLHNMATDPSDVWLKITDEDNGGCIVSASNWKVYPTYSQADFDRKMEGVEKITAEDVKHFTDRQQKEDACFVLKDLLERRWRNTREAHVLLNMLFTHPHYHRHGAGRTMVTWGNSLADALSIPCWVEASDTGHHLYHSCGYRDVEKAWNQKPSIPVGDGVMTYTLMKREVPETVRWGRVLGTGEKGESEVEGKVGRGEEVKGSLGKINGMMGLRDGDEGDEKERMVAEAGEVYSKDTALEA